MKNKLLLSMLIFITAHTCFATNDENFEWIQYTHNNKLMARATSIEKECPNINIDGKEIPMLFRAEKYDIELKETVRICEQEVTNAKQVSIRGNSLKLVATKINRFIVLGDTGCEASFFDKHFVKQDCTDLNSWPFKTVADQVASVNPDLIIHMGDYSYRNKFTDKIDEAKNKDLQWFFMKQDFFTPASNMLHSAPMLFVRGNHDKCELMGDAWFLFFDAQAHQKECLKQSPTYNLNINDLNFMVFDSAEAPSGPEYSLETLEKYKSDFATGINNLKKKAWLLIHHPIISLNELAQGETINSKIPAQVISDAFLESYTKNLPIAISGHFHLMADIKRKTDGFEQFITGNGGTIIHKAKRDAYTYFAKDENEQVQARVKYGYLQFDRKDDNNWKVTAYSMHGIELYTTMVSNP